MNDIEVCLKNIGVGPRTINDPFFKESYEVCNIFQRKGVTVEDEEELCHKFMEKFTCNVPGCKEEFENLLDYEIHYNGSHRYVCQECKKSLPTPKILDIHLQEMHDTFFQVLAERQSMYQCYVSECEEKFSNPCERRDHYISIHKFPKNFRFDTSIKNKNKQKFENMEIDQLEKPWKPKKSVLVLNKNQKSKSFQNFSSTETQNINPIKPNLNNFQTNCSESMKKSALMFLPRQVLQKSYAKVLTKNESREKNVVEKETMMDLAESLPTN